MLSEHYLQAGKLQYQAMPMNSTDSIQDIIMELPFRSSVISHL